LTIRPNGQLTKTIILHRFDAIFKSQNAAYSAPPDPLAGGRGLAAPSPRNPPPLSALRASHSAYPHFIPWRRVWISVIRAWRIKSSSTDLQGQRNNAHLLHMDYLTKPNRGFGSSWCLEKPWYRFGSKKP